MEIVKKGTKWLKFDQPHLFNKNYFISQTTLRHKVYKIYTKCHHFDYTCNHIDYT